MVGRTPFYLNSCEKARPSWVYLGEAIGMKTATQCINQLIRISCKGLSETPLYWFDWLEGLSVGPFIHYPLKQE